MTPRLLDQLRQLALLEPDQLEEVERTLHAQFPEPKMLARELVRRGWLTTYQADLLLQGRGPELVLGSYVLLEQLGEGGMGAIFKARHKMLGRVVALKLVRKDRLANEAAVKRFRREIKAAAQLNHPNIVLAFDADQAGETHFFTMEYVAGTDLAQLVKAKGPLPVDQACDYIRQAAVGLQHAYACGLVHRDIKPSNLLVTAAGVVKILDMGLARMSTGGSGEEKSSLTQTGMVMGTPDYIAPEQAREARDVDIRADLYSLGCTFYYLLTGQVPFPKGALASKLLQHQLDESTPVEELRPEVPAGVAAIVRKLMAKQPEDRYQTPAEVAERLAAIGDRPSAPPALSPPNADRRKPAAEPSTMITPITAQRKRRQADRRRLLRFNVVGGTVLLVLLGVLAFMFTHPGPAPSPSRVAVALPAPSDTAIGEAKPPVLAVGGRSPLDDLRQDRIPAELLKAVADGDPAKVPPELVGMLQIVPASDGAKFLNVTSLAFPPDGSFITIGGHAFSLTAWDLPALNRTHKYDLSAHITRQLLRDQGRLLATVNSSGSFFLYDAATGKVVRREDRPDTPPETQRGAAQVFRPDQQRVAIGFTDGLVRILDTANGQERGRFQVPGQVLLLAYSPDGKRLAVRFEPKEGAKILLLRDLETGQATWPADAPGLERTMSFLRFSSDGGSLLYTDSYQYYVRSLDLEKGTVRDLILSPEWNRGTALTDCPEFFPAIRQG